MNSNVSGVYVVVLGSFLFFFLCFLVDCCLSKVNAPSMMVAMQKKKKKEGDDDDEEEEEEMVWLVE